MPYRIFSIMIPSDEATMKELNAFCGSHRLVAVTHHPMEREGIPYEVFVVEYLDDASSGVNQSARSVSQGTVDYKKVLSEGDYEVYLRLHKLRKEMAKAEGVEVFVVFTNEQLAAMARTRCDSLAELGKIQGIGKGRLEKYGKAFLEAIQAGGGEGIPVKSASSEEEQTTMEESR